MESQTHFSAETQSKWEKMETSLVVAFDYALGVFDELEQIEIIDELYSYASIVGDMDNQQIDELYNRAL